MSHLASSAVGRGNPVSPDNMYALGYALPVPPPPGEGTGRLPPLGRGWKGGGTLQTLPAGRGVGKPGLPSSGPPG